MSIPYSPLWAPLSLPGPLMDWLMPVSLQDAWGDRMLPGAAQGVRFAPSTPIPTPTSGSSPGYRALSSGSEGPILALSTVVPLRPAPLTRALLVTLCDLHTWYSHWLAPRRVGAGHFLPRGWGQPLTLWTHRIQNHSILRSSNHELIALSESANHNTGLQCRTEPGDPTAVGQRHHHDRNERKQSSVLR